MTRPRIVPELYCSDFSSSLAFFTDVLGFEVRYARPEERFAYLDLEGAELMIAQTVEGERTLVAAELVAPFGRGVNLQIEVNDVEALYERVQTASARIFWPLEERWYRAGDIEVGSRQFVVMDPDGYLLRFSANLSERPA